MRPEPSTDRSHPVIGSLLAAAALVALLVSASWGGTALGIDTEARTDEAESAAGAPPAPEPPPPTEREESAESPESPPDLAPDLCELAERIARLPPCLRADDCLAVDLYRSLMGGPGVQRTRPPSMGRTPRGGVVLAAPRSPGRSLRSRPGDGDAPGDLPVPPEVRMGLCRAR